MKPSVSAWTDGAPWVHVSFDTGVAVMTGDDAEAFALELTQAVRKVREAESEQAARKRAYLEKQACCPVSAASSGGSSVSAVGIGGSSVPPVGAEGREKALTGTEHAGPAPAADAGGDVLPPEGMPEALRLYWTRESRVWAHVDDEHWVVHPAKMLFEDGEVRHVPRSSEEAHRLDDCMSFRPNRAREGV